MGLILGIIIGYLIKSYQKEIITFVLTLVNK